MRPKVAGAPMSMVHVENCALAHVLAACQAHRDDVRGKAFFVRDFDENIVCIYRELSGNSPPLACLPYWFLSILVHCHIVLHLLLLACTGGRYQLLGGKQGLHHGALAAALPCTVDCSRARDLLGYQTVVTRDAAVESSTRAFQPIVKNAHDLLVQACQRGGA